MIKENKSGLIVQFTCIPLQSQFTFININCPAMTLAVDLGRKATKQTNKRNIDQYKSYLQHCLNNIYKINLLPLRYAVIVDCVYNIPLFISTIYL